MKVSKNENIDAEIIKSRILKFLYSHVPKVISFVEITKEAQMTTIDKSFKMVPELIGVRSWIVFFHHGDQYYAINFPKVSDSYRKKTEWNVYALNISARKELYQGTIMEGIYTRSSSNRYLIVDDVYFYKGINVKLKQFSERMKIIHEFVDKGFKKTSDINIYPANVFPVIKDGMTRLFNDMKINPAIRRVVFVPPEIVKTKMFYTVIKTDLIDDIIRTAKLLMVRTKNKTKDIYHLYQKNEQKIGLASIPTLELSETICDWYREAKTSKIIVKCHFENQRQKWIPMEYLKPWKE